MASQFPSIQSFFEKEIPAKKGRTRGSDRQIDTNDGFSEDEVQRTLHPTLHRWNPRNEYEDSEISSLVPGPGCRALQGRVVNFYQQQTPSKKPQAARGCLKVVVKDDTGTLMVRLKDVLTSKVRLWYAKVDYKLRLGQLVSVWTPHISTSDLGSLTSRGTSLVTSIFPERDNSCYFMVQDNSDSGALCKTPLGYVDGKQLASLMTLKSFVDGGHEVDNGKILVCVKSIGGRKKLTDKKGNPIEKVDVNVFDDTFQATLTLWNHVTDSATSWRASHTVLLITSAVFRDGGRPGISMSSTTQVEVDPQMRDAEWLRAFAQRLIKKDHVNHPFPEDVFDVETAATAQHRILFSIADIDEFVRASPSEIYTGYLNVLVTELSITRLHQRNMLCCTECCGVPLYANAPTAICKQCETDTPLRLNPRLIGTLLDETGSLAAGKLIWSEHAWEQLLGRTVAELVGSSAHALRYLEQRILFLRVTLLFGWSAQVHPRGRRRAPGISCQEGLPNRHRVTYFKCALKDACWKEGKENKVELPEDAPEAWRIAIGFFMTNDIPPHIVQACDCMPGYHCGHQRKLDPPVQVIGADDSTVDFNLADHQLGDWCYPDTTLATLKNLVDVFCLANKYLWLDLLTTCMEKIRLFPLGPAALPILAVTEVSANTVSNLIHAGIKGCRTHTPHPFVNSRWQEVPNPFEPLKEFFKANMTAEAWKAFSLLEDSRLEQRENIRTVIGAGYWECCEERQGVCIVEWDKHAHERENTRYLKRKQDASRQGCEKIAAETSCESHNEACLCGSTSAHKQTDDQAKMDTAGDSSTEITRESFAAAEVGDFIIDIRGDPSDARYVTGLVLRTHSRGWFLRSALRLFEPRASKYCNGSCCEPRTFKYDGCRLYLDDPLNEGLKLRRGRRRSGG
ncbi:hypothetical protein MMC26_005782 [Xylographa opegraphella]|nr:hypothetical protein [Xylographa opegraphella]